MIDLALIWIIKLGQNFVIYNKIKTLTNNKAKKHIKKK